MKGLKKIRRQLIIILLSLFVMGTIHATFAQKKAEEWFQDGVNAADLNEKITNYKKAIEQNPFFIEAYYNLGLVYKKLGDYKNAEESFRLAQASNPEKLNPDIKLKIFYELGITYKKLNRFDEAKTTLVEAINIAGNPQLRATIWYEIGIISILQEKFDEAVIQLNEGKKIAENKTGQFDQAIKLANQKKNSQIYYQQGLNYLTQQNPEDALESFKKAQAFDPTYKDVQSQIAKLEKSGNVITPGTADSETNLPELYRRAVSSLNDKKFQEAITLFERILAHNPDFLDAKAQLELARTQLQPSVPDPEIEKNYERGMRALRNRDYLEAFITLEKVRSINPNYKQVQWGLNQAKQNFQRQTSPEDPNSQANLSYRFYTEGLTAMQNQKWVEAVNAFEMVSQINPRYRNTQKFLIDARSKLDSTKLNRLTEVESELKNREAQLYFEQGLANIKRENWVQAVIALEKAEVLQPGNLDEVKKELTLAREKLAEQEMSYKVERQQFLAEMNSSSSWMAFFSVLSIIVLFLFALLYFIPTARARFHLIRGKYDKAKPIYESLLTTRPGDPELYKTLANIYLIEGREDEPAIRIYESIIRMNINTQRNEDIKVILRKYYKKRDGERLDSSDLIEEKLDPRISEIKNGKPSVKE
ncbi:tetratricopeptide repeat protein [candidate division KSB1 bacterium]|nr:tetratricopeptide repeat protein [candidate division KSB1 bacterium]